MNVLRLTLPLLAALATSACVTLPSQEVPASPAVERAASTRASADRIEAADAAHAPRASTTQKASPPLFPQGPLQSLSAVPAPAPQPAVAALEAPKDLWERMRRGFAIREPDTTLVRQQEQWYASRPDYIQRMTQRSSKYLFHIVEEVERRNLPQELALLPFIESAFNPQAVSHAKAAGMWQFMPATGRYFDLKQNAFRDDRRDVLASTRAALDYLERLHRMFGDWHLALAAYNWGEGNVQRAINRNRAAGLGTGYLDLRMPDETRQYVPKLMGVKNIVNDPARFQVDLPAVGNHPFFDSVAIDRDLDVSLIAELAEVSEADFRQLNPSHNKPVIMAAGTPTILLPWDNALLFDRRLREHTGPSASWTAWRVPKNMTVAQAAKEHDLSEAELREVNRIPARMQLRAGATVLVPRHGQLDRDVPEHVADNGQILLMPEHSGGKATRVKVRSGDSLAAIAKRHRVSVAQLQQWNKLKPNAKLRAGQTLVLHGVPSQKTAKAKKAGPKKPPAKAVAKGKSSPSTRVVQSGSKTPVVR
jgi:membrane-bound lytic murein transglycosylase D